MAEASARVKNLRTLLAELDELRSKNRKKGSKNAERRDALQDAFFDPEDSLLTTVLGTFGENGQYLLGDLDSLPAAGPFAIACGVRQMYVEALRGAITSGSEILDSLERDDIPELLREEEPDES